MVLEIRLFSVAIFLQSAVHAVLDVILQSAVSFLQYDSATVVDLTHLPYHIRDFFVSVQAYLLSYHVLYKIQRWLICHLRHRVLPLSGLAAGNQVLLQ